MQNFIFLGAAVVRGGLIYGVIFFSFGMVFEIFGSWRHEHGMGMVFFLSFSVQRRYVYPECFRLMLK